MFHMEYATEQDEPFWKSVDMELPTSEFLSKIRDKRAFVIKDDDKSIGVLRYNLFWDVSPFLPLILLEKQYRGMGYEIVMTSTMVNENAQHFYRKLGYIERGSIFLDNTPISQPQEMIFIKIL